MYRKSLTAVTLLFLLIAGCEKSAPPVEPSTGLTETNEAAHYHDDHDHDHDHDHGYRDAGMHQHGAAEMTLVLEENLLSISLSLPAMDVLGFERAAKTEQEQQQLGQAVADLRDARNMLALTPAAHCELGDAEVQSGLLNAGQAVKNHADFLVFYEFTCQAPEQLSSVGASVFKHYPSLSTLQLTWIINAQQGLETLSPDKPAFHF